VNSGPAGTRCCGHPQTDTGEREPRTREANPAALAGEVARSSGRMERDDAGLDQAFGEGHRIGCINHPLDQIDTRRRGQRNAFGPGEPQQPEWCSDAIEQYLQPAFAHIGYAEPGRRSGIGGGLPDGVNRKFAEGAKLRSAVAKGVGAACEDGIARPIGEQPLNWFDRKERRTAGMQTNSGLMPVLRNDP
jgi:hypothetical protein